MLAPARRVAAISGVFLEEAEIHRRVHGTTLPEWRQTGHPAAITPAFRV
jgi:hypothetical protein